MYTKPNDVMERPSAYYHDECEFQEITETICIECEDCIDKHKNAQCCKPSGFTDYQIECKCFGRRITKMTCIKCRELEKLKQKLIDESDDILYNLSYDIKNYRDCEEQINRLHGLSKSLRKINSVLLEKMP